MLKHKGECSCLIPKTSCCSQGLFWGSVSWPDCICVIASLNCRIGSPLGQVRSLCSHAVWLYSPSVLDHSPGLCSWHCHCSSAFCSLLISMPKSEPKGTPKGKKDVPAGSSEGQPMKPVKPDAGASDVNKQMYIAEMNVYEQDMQLFLHGTAESALPPPSAAAAAHKES